jgi:hypothetical protein
VWQVRARRAFELACVRTSASGRRAACKGLNGCGGHTRRQAGGAQCARFTLMLLLRVMPTSGYRHTRYMTKNLKMVKRVTSRKGGQRVARRQAALDVCRAHACAAARSDFKQEGPRQFGNRFPSARKVPNRREPSWNPTGRQEV